MRRPLTPPELHTWSTSDGYVLHGRLWPSSTSTPLGILYLHGIQSHGAWFEWSASLLAGAGYPVLLPDRRGSGLNPAARGDTPSAERWLQDLDELAEWLRSAHGVGQLAIVGVSWGGKLAVAWTLRRPQLVHRLLLIAPGFFPAVDLGLGQRLLVSLALVTRPTRMSRIPLDDPTLFTDNPEGRAFIAADQLKLTQASARFWYASACLDWRLRRVRQGQLRTPVTLLLAGRDRIVRNEPTVTWLRHCAARAPIVVTVPSAAHTLEFEADSAEFARHLEEWAVGLRRAEL